MGKILAAVLIYCLLQSCQSGTNPDTGDSTKRIVQAETLVSVAHPVDTIRISRTATLNATASYLLKSDVKSNTTGYISKMYIKPGDGVKREQILFVLETKEARALGNTINVLDGSFRFSGVTSVVSPVTGFVVALNHQIGDYVQDGEILASVADAASFGFVVEVPFEYLNIVRKSKILSIVLPGGEVVQGKVSKIMPDADPVSQTVRVLLKTARTDIPENIIGTISFPVTSSMGLSVPRSALLSDDTQSSFWVMKLINENTAVKVPVVRGIESDRFVEIIGQGLSTKDLVLTSGNFGLPDTASIKIQK